MNIATSMSVPLRSPAETLGVLDIDAAARLAEASGDLVLVLGADGTIIDLAMSSTEVAIEGADHWIGKRWLDVVTAESRAKVEDMLGVAKASKPTRWRQVNHPTSSGDVPVRYWALPSGHDGRVIAVGRDLRASAALQQRLLQAQQALERDYLRLRQAESALSHAVRSRSGSDPCRRRRHPAHPRGEPGGNEAARCARSEPDGAVADDGGRLECARGR